MTTFNAYQEASQAYAYGTRALLAPSGTVIGERGTRAPASIQDLADQAEQLTVLSENLTQATAARLTNPDLGERIDASTQLLAKALVDLETSAYLLQAAMDEEDQIEWTVNTQDEHRIASRTAAEEYLKILLGETPVGLQVADRAARQPQDIPSAQGALIAAVEDSLALISERASEGGQGALNGLLALGASELLAAAGAVGTDIAQAFGQADKITRLYNVFREFVNKAYEAVLALLGPQLSKTVADSVVAWVTDLREGKLFGKLLEQLYDTGQTTLTLGQVVTNSQASLEKFTFAIETVEGLEATYRQQIWLAEKLLKGARYLGGVPAAALPYGKLAFAVIYILLGGYIIVAGADYVDAQKLKLLDRVPGVRQVVEHNLLSAA